MFKKFTNNESKYDKYKNVKSDLICGNLDLISKPFISIIIPTYKRYSMLKFAIESAIIQKEPAVEYEIIIVDNESCQTESETERLVKAYNNKKILYYRNKENIGMFGNWNRGIELARGEWVAFLHDDDLLDVDYINKVLFLLKRKKSIGAILSKYKIINSDSNQLPKEKEQSNFFKAFVEKQLRNKLLRLKPIDSQLLGNIYGAPTCGAIFRKKYLIAMGGFDENYFPSADWFFLYAFSKRFKLYKTNLSFGYYRFLENESLNPKTLKSFLEQSIEFRRYLSSTTMFGKILECFFSNERYFQTKEWIEKLNKNSIFEINVLNEEYGYSYRAKRQLLFRLIQRIYWYGKSVVSIILG
jgi:glycosyltransferase